MTFSINFTGEDEQIFHVKHINALVLKNSKLRLWLLIKLYLKILMMFRVVFCFLKCMKKKCSSIKFHHVWTCVCDWWDELCWTNVCACNLLFISKSVKYQGFPTPEPQLIFDILMIVFALLYFWHQDRVEYLFSINLHIPHPYLSHSFARHFWLAFHFNRESINKLKTCDNLKNVTSATSKCALQTNLMFNE